MGVPVVGERHHGKADASQGEAWMFGAISKRIGGMCGADALRLTINNQSKRKNLQKTTVNTLWQHCREELPLKEISTQDAYLVYGKNWFLPRWGNLLLEDIKTR